jgi:hypothetical protein
MTQAPQYLIIGNGRVARHFDHYFSLIDIPVKVWNRQQSIAELAPLIAQASHILLLISDSAIEEFAKQYLTQSKALKIHFSGSLVSHHVYGAHPLMTFDFCLYALKQYQSMPFVLEENAPSFHELLPGLHNPHRRIAIAHKAKYHALCVLSGNFSIMLWQKFMQDLEQEFHLPRSFAHAYLQQICENLIDHPSRALSGPLVRNDWETIERNLKALDNDPFQAVYESFVTCYSQIKDEK